MMKEKLSIGEVARLAGVQTSAIRYYERVGILPAPSRMNGRRQYTPEVLQHLLMIKFAQQAGLTIPEIRTNFRGSDWRALARQKMQEAQDRMEQVQRMMRILEVGLSLEETSFEEGVVRFLRAMEQIDLKPNNDIHEEK